MINNFQQQQWLSSSIKGDGDDNDSVATGATFLLITKPDGSRSCLKHPEKPIPNGMFSCPACDLEFSQYQEMLKKKKASVDFHLKEIKEEQQQQQQQQQKDGKMNAIVLRSPAGQSSQYQLQSQEAIKSSSTTLPQQQSTSSGFHHQQPPSTAAAAAAAAADTSTQSRFPPSQRGQIHNATSFHGYGNNPMAAPPTGDVSSSFPPMGTNFSPMMNFAMSSGPSTTMPPSSTPSMPSMPSSSMPSMAPSSMPSMPPSSMPSVPFSSMPPTMDQQMPPYMQQMNHPLNPMQQQQQQYSPFDTFTAQMQRMQQMQEWMLKQKEEEVVNLRKKVEVQQKALHEQAIQIAVFREKYQQQEEQMERMREELKLAYATINSNKYDTQDQQQHQKQKKGKEHTNNTQTYLHDSTRFGNNEFQRQQQQSKEHPPEITKAINEKVENLQISSNLLSQSVKKESSELPKSSTFQNSKNSSRERLRFNATTTKVSAPLSAISPDTDTTLLRATANQSLQGTKKSKDGSRRMIPQLETDIYGFQMIGNIIDFDDSASNAVPSVEELTLGTAGRDASNHNSLTVASTTYGEDRVQVVENSLLDPYGDEGTYTGTILKTTGMPHGKGKMVYAIDKRVYDGDWRHGRWHGYGCAVFANGDNYEGEYRFDHRHGKGKYYWSDGRIYDGIFSEDKRHGTGIFKWPDGAIYEGEFNNGQRDGHGSYTFNDGGQYVGGWKDGRYNGYGTCTWEDGRYYKGEWKDGAAHGKGVETYVDGTVRHDGLWLNDLPVRNSGEKSI